MSGGRQSAPLVSSAAAPAATVTLDGTSGEALQLDDWLDRADAAVDAALAQFRVVATAPNGARVYAGRLPGAPVLSMMWSQEFDAADAGGLADVLGNSDNMHRHATGWDSTYAGAQVLKKLEGQGATDGFAVLWKYSASPLAARELLFVNARKEVGSEGAVIYGYPSVANSWVSANLQGTAVPKTGRVRSANLFPTCDRVTPVDGGKRVRVDHLMTTRLGGWITDCCYSNFFKSALVKTYTHEAEAFKEYVVKQR